MANQGHGMTMKKTNDKTHMMKDNINKRIMELFMKRMCSTCLAILCNKKILEIEQNIRNQLRKCH